MADLPEFIYRFGSRIKDLALIRQVDWLTGLSFYTEPFGKEYNKLMEKPVRIYMIFCTGAACCAPTIIWSLFVFSMRVKTLIANGFVVRLDENALMTLLWSGQPYIEPNSGEQLRFPDNHISVWHPDKPFWDAWYETDVPTKNTTEVSKQLAYFALARITITP